MILILYRFYSRALIGMQVIVVLSENIFAIFSENHEATLAFSSVNSILVLLFCWKSEFLKMTPKRHKSYTSGFKLTRRLHNMRNSLRDETSCESSTALTYSTLNVLTPNGQ